MRRCLPSMIALCALGNVLLLAALARAETPVSLVSKRQTGDLARVGIQVEVGGELKLLAEDDVQTLKMSVAAELEYDEKLLSVVSPDAGSHREGDERAVRHYGKADAVIKLQDGGVKPTLRKDRRLVAVAAGRKSSRMNGVDAPLSREELELLDVVGNSLLLEQMLPEKPVTVSEKWTLDKTLLAMLLGLDVVAESDVDCQLKAVDEGVARVELEGHVTGAVYGASTEVDLKGRYTFDLQRGRISWCALVLDEQRSVSMVGPGIDATAKIEMTIRPIADSKHLPADVERKADVAFREMAAAGVSLAYRSPGDRFQMQHGAGWHVISEDPTLVVLRLIEQGKLVAQCNISPLGKLDAQREVTLANFKSGIEESLGEHFGEHVSDEELPGSGGRRIYRVVVDGTSGKLPIRWIYYRLLEPDGRHAVVVFSMHEEMVDRFADAADPILRSFEFPDPETPTTAAKSDRESRTH